jgi:hypothetical protein
MDQQPIVPIRVASESFGGTKASEEQMTRQSSIIKDEKKPLAPKAEDQSHKPAKHIEETARLAGSVETVKDLSKVRRTKD